MWNCLLCVSCLGWLLVTAVAAAEGDGAANESLRFSLNLPSGLSVGDVALTSQRHAAKQSFKLSFEAAVPGYQFKDTLEAEATHALCSLSLLKHMQHGKRRTSETVKFDQERGLAIRTTHAGGQSEAAVPPCAKDALTFLYFVRRELAQGRLPAPQSVSLGAAYQVKLEYAGRQAIQAAGQRQEADKLLASITGPASNIKAELFFARDAVRTPLRVRLPLANGLFLLELAE